MNIPIELTIREPAGNRDPLNRSYELNSGGYFGKVSRDDGAELEREIRANGSYRDVTEGQRFGGGEWRFYLVGEVPADMVTTAANNARRSKRKTGGNAR